MIVASGNKKILLIIPQKLIKVNNVVIVKELNMFAENLKKKREEKGISTYKLAELIGVSQPYITQLEKDQKDPPAGKVLCRMADVLECSTDYLLGRE